jgi:hypothetical protein
MQYAINCIKNWCKEISLSVNAGKTTMVLFTNKRKIGGFYNLRLFGTDDGSGEISGISLIGTRILKIGYTKPALHIGSVVMLWDRLGDYHQRWWPDGYTLPW